MKKIIIVHGWGFSPKHNWYPWLAERFRELEFEVLIPEMPETKIPNIDSWVDRLREVAGDIDEDTYFVGHSIGCQAVMRFLAQQTSSCGGFFFIGPWLVLNEERIQEEVLIYGKVAREVADEWEQTPINFERIIAITKTRKVFLSDNDYYVPLEENKNLFEKYLQADVSVFQDKGHFVKKDGVTELPEILEKIKEEIL